MPTVAEIVQGIQAAGPFKYVDWTRGKKGKGGSWGHIQF
jgi:hypothetical protein